MAPSSMGRSSVHSEITNPVTDSQGPIKPCTLREQLLSLFGGLAANLTVLGIAGLVGWYGFKNDWKLPVFSTNGQHSNEEDDWCSEHKVPESICIECNDALMPKPKEKGWCRIHGVSECVLCNPALAQLGKTPVVTKAEMEQSVAALAFEKRTANIPNCKTHLRRIQFATSDDADKSGIVVEPVWRSPVVEFISAPGEIIFDQTRVSHLSARASGTIWKMFKRLGDEVRAGEVIALVEAAEVGKAKTELLQTFANLQLKAQSLANLQDAATAVPASKILESDVALKEADIRLGAACQALTNLGLPIDEGQVKSTSASQLKERLHGLGIPAQSLGAQHQRLLSSNLLPVVSPMDGRVVSTEMVAGEVVDTAKVLFEIAEPKSMWLTLDIRGEDAHRVQKGQLIRFQTHNSTAELVGTITWKSAQVDPKTRTIKVRADLANPDQTLLANTYGTGRVILREEQKAITVPSEAVQWDGCCHVVFVRDKDYLKSDLKVFHVRKVRVGAKAGKNTELIAGVLPNELVVTKGSGLLLTELLRGSLGEGCACHSKK